MTTGALSSALVEIFNVPIWTNTQHEAFKLIDSYVNDLMEENRIFETKDDKIVIRDNIKEQDWFHFSKSKPIISQLLDSMKLTNHTFKHNKFYVNMYVVLNFNQFQLVGCFYQNFINNMVNFYIYFENQKKQKAYLTYYTSPSTVPQSDKILKLPEFDRIYEITNISQNILYQCDLLNFFAEIVMYYDESQTIGNLPIGNGFHVTLDQLIHKLNSFVSQKNNETNYKIL